MTKEEQDKLTVLFVTMPIKRECKYGGSTRAEATLGNNNVSDLTLNPWVHSK